jgi:adenylate kinase family enzyme
MNNFKILHGVLRNVGVKFDTNTAQNIMQSKPGFIANLLYEIRSNLEKKGVNPENISLKKSSHFQEMYAPMKFRQEIPQYDAFDSKHFYETLQRKTRAQKEIDLENKLKRFEDFKIEQNKKIKQAIAEEQYRLEQEKAINIRNHRNKNQRYHAFLQQFEEKGINNWKNNMLRAKQREIKDVQFQLNEAQKIQKNLYRGIARNIAIYHHEIKQFEENFGKNGKKRTDLTAGKKEENEKKGESNESHIASAKVGPNDLENMGGNTGIQTNANFGSAPHFESVDTRAASICSGIYQKIMLDNRTKTERNRRRRKIIVEQGKAQLEIENKRREEQYIGKLAKQSNQEKQLTYETYRVNQCKNIIRENRNLREEMYKKRDEGNKEFQKINEDNYLKFHIENFHRDQEKEDNRKKDLEISQKQKQRNQNSDICRSMVDLIVDISDKAYEYQQINDVEEIDPRVWREWTNLFKNNESVLFKPQEEAKDKKETENKEEEKEKSENQEPEEEKEAKETKEKKETVEEGDANKAASNENPEEKKQEEESIHIDINSRYNKTFYSIFNTGDTSCTKLDQILDECEFYEYQNNKGQWNPEIIPESAFVSLKPDDLTFNYTQPLVNQEQNKKEKGGKNVNAGKGGANDKAKPENIEEMMKLENPNDLIIPKENVKNCLFGDLIGVLIDLKYEEEKKKYQEEKDAKKNLFRYIPIKIAIIGKDYSGKRTQAKILSENFPLKIYDLGELVKDALNILSSKRETSNKFLLTNSIKNKTLQKDEKPNTNENNNANPNANNANAPQNVPNNDANNTALEKANNTVAQMRTEQAAEEVKYSKIKELAREIKLRLGNGEGVPDEIYAELLCEYIKIDFPPKDDFEVTNEIIERVSRKEKVLEEIEKNKEENIKRPKTFERKDKELNDELMKISLEASKGFVVVNFPNTYNQAKLLENILSGYIPKSESRQLKSNKMKNIFSIVLDKSEEILPPNKLILGGFDFIFYINVPGNECIRRAVGRRLFYDTKNKEKKNISFRR